MSAELFGDEPEIGTTPTSSTCVEIHEPRLFVLKRCLERCHHLPELGGCALMMAATCPTGQFDVVCDNPDQARSPFNCAGIIIKAGTYVGGAGFASGGHRETCVPGRTDPDGHGATNAIRRAIEAGMTPHRLGEVETIESRIKVVV